MSIIRFRTAVKDSHDIVFIFFALATGLAAGVGLYQVALVGVVFIGFVILLLYQSEFGAVKKREFLLQFSYASDDHESPPYLEIINKYCKKSKLVNVRSIGIEDQLELSYYILFFDMMKSNTFISDLDAMKGVSNINLFFDDEVG